MVVLWFGLQLNYLIWCYSELNFLSNFCRMTLKNGKVILGSSVGQEDNVDSYHRDF